MNRVLISIVSAGVFAGVIVMLFLPFIKDHDNGYDGVTAADKTDEAMTMSEEVASVPDVMPEQAVVEEAEVVEPVKVEAVVEQAATIEPAKVAAVVAEDATPEVSAPTGKEDEKAALYTVVDGNKLDANSYAGFKLFRNWCARCHGTYGQGMVGPNLADSLKIISEKEFFNTVENGKAGSIGSMPAWKANVKVMAGRDQLYAYLMARSDGAIGVVKPQKQ